MVESISNRVVARSAAAVFLLSGAMSLATSPMLGKTALHLRAALLTGVLSLGLGAVAWFTPWGRWSRRAPLWLTPAAFALMAAGPALGGGIQFTYGMYFLMAFVWFGIGFPRGTSLLMAAPAALAFAIGILAERGPEAQVLSLLLVIPICAAVGEVLAWWSSKLRNAETLDSHHVRDMTKLLVATELLARQTEWEGAPTLICELASGLVGGGGAVLMLSQPGGMLGAEGSWNWPDPEALNWIDPASRTDLTTAIASRRPLLEDADASGPFSHWASLLVKPLTGTTRVLGVLVVGFVDTARPFDGFTESVAKTFATQSGLAVERLQVKEWLVDATMRDDLTGVGNRRAAEAALDHLRTGDACVLLDIDHFKQVNDTLGHQAGDDTLRLLAAHLLGSLREGDIIARYGGDEFLLILRRPGGLAQQAMERIAETWRAASPSVSFSAGIAEHGADASAAETVARADEALYSAKRAGRGRVMSWEPPQTRLSA